jgi:predicted transcriptional regulator of viral defense system
VGFRECLYKGVKFPKSLVRNGLQHFMTSREMVGCQAFLVASTERAVVEILDRPDLVGGWLAARELLSSLSNLDLDAVVEYVKALGNSTTAAKVGYYLAGREAELSVAGRHLQALAAMKPNQPHYLDRSRRRDGRLVSEWNLMVDRESEAGRA